jgi:hypothetical protein
MDELNHEPEVNLALATTLEETKTKRNPIQPCASLRGAANGG